MTEPVLSDALFLAAHPGWTWRALQETPADVVDVLGRAERLASEIAAARNR